MSGEHLCWATFILGASFVYGCRLLAEAIKVAVPRNVNWFHHNDKERPR